ncbi:hypothetical protein ACHQM5_006346 [Ranunculus cassubicifolius]
MKIYMKITKTVSLHVNKSDTIRNVKAKLSQVEGLSSNTQELFFAGNHLKNGNKLVDYEIQNGSTIQMFLGSATNMKIHIKALWLGEMITIDVSHWETIQNVKAKVQDIVGVLISRISLIFVGKELEDTQTLASYNIQTGSTLLAVFRGDDRMRIFVHTVMNGTLEVEVKPLYSIEYVKVLLESIVNIPSHRQRLLFSERIMENEKTLLYYNVQNASELRMVLVMAFFVETWSGKRIEMIMESSVRISAVKRKIEEVESIASYKQVLSFCGLQLEDSQDLAYYKIEGGSTLKLDVNNEMQIFIRTLEGRTRSLNVLRSDSIASLKERIKAKEWIPKNRQNLNLIFCGKVLDDDRSLEEYGIEKESNLQVALIISCCITEVPVFVKTLTGKEIKFNLLPSSTIGSLKAKIEDMEKLPKEQQKLKFNSELLANERSLAYYGIVLLESIVSIPSHQQRLLFSERVMEDDKALLHYNVQNASAIRMILVTMFFVETSSGKRIEMVMESSNSISVVKRKIQETEFVPPYKQRLSFCGLQLEDSRTLAHYKIERGSTLKLDIQCNGEMQIFVRTLEGRTRVVNVLRSDSVASLKEKIEVKERIPKDLQNLVFGGKLLESNRSLEEYGIEKESTLHLGLALSQFIVEVPVYVRTWSGRVLTFKMPLSNTIDSLKAMIEEMERIPKTQQRLMFGGKLLRDKRSLNYYGIAQGCTLSLSA